MIFTPMGRGTWPTSLTSMGGIALLQRHRRDHGCELWKSDGSEAGTTLVIDIDPTDSACVSKLTAFNGELFFSADDGVHGRELWKSDGTETGTQMVKDISTRCHCLGVI